MGKDRKQAPRMDFDARLRLEFHARRSAPMPDCPPIESAYPSNDILNREIEDLMARPVEARPGFSINALKNSTKPILLPERYSDKIIIYRHVKITMGRYGNIGSHIDENAQILPKN